MPETTPNPMLQRIGKRLGDLRIRLKLMVFHNVFFVLLAFTVYLSVIPVLDSRLQNAYQREEQMLRTVLASQPSMLRTADPQYEYDQGTAAQLGMPADVQEWVDEHPGEVWYNPERSSYLYHKDRGSELYQRVKLPREQYQQMIRNARWALTLVLLATYVLGVLVLEFVVLPLFVYRPIRLLLDADAAAKLGDRQKELVPEGEIPDDELGDLMRSRNGTLRVMRQQEDELAEALVREHALSEDLRRKNEQLENARRSLADQDRLASLGLMSASVAHELNTPLAVLQGSIEKLEECTQDGPSRDRLARMKRVAHRLKTISSSLLDFARVRSSRTEPVAMRELIDECWQLVSIDDKARQVQFSNLLPDELFVQGNPDRLSQVFVNLLRNSLHEITVSGHIWVRGEWQKGETEFATLRVEDDGPGIPASVLPHLFEAFVTTRLDSHGTGLGLTVAEGIIQQHRGKIRAYNRPEGGACLEVELPLAAHAESTFVSR